MEFQEGAGVSEELFTLNQFEANNQQQQVENSLLNKFNSLGEMSSAATAVDLNETNVCNRVNIKRAINTILELSDEELNRIEENLRFKIIKNSENFLNQFDNLRASNEKLKIEFEQHFLDLEAEYKECRAKLESESKSNHLNQMKANEFDEKLNTYLKQNRILNDEKETLISNVHRLNSVNHNLEAEKRDLHIRLDKFIRDNDRLNEEWKSINNKLSDVESKLALYTARLEESQNREATITFREKQFQSDKQRLMNEIEWLNSELEKKSSLMLQSRSEYNKKSFEFESKLDDLTAENKKLKSLNDSLQSANQSMEQQIDDLTTKLHEIRDKYAQARLDFEEESQSREKIIKLYQEEAQSSKQKLDDASQAITELNQMVLEIRNEYSNLLDEKTTIETAFESKLKENTEIIAKLEQELKNANELLSIAKRKGATVLSEADIEQLSPAAAVASRLLKNGMTLTQIYSEYVNLAEALQTQKTENQRLTSYINEIVREIDEKAPVLKRQKCEYEEAVKTIDSLTNQLENAMMDYEVLKSKSEDSIKKYNLVSSENIRFRQDCNDLSRQVTVLLHEVEKLRSKLMNASRKSTGNTNSNNLNASSSEHNVSAYSETNESLAEVTSSSEIVSKDILLFRNIEELQKQNQKLVRLLHEVTDKKQSEEKNELEQKTKEYNEKLNLALRELDEFKIQREKHEQVLDEIRKQRDTYKQLLNSQQHQQLRNGSSNQQQQSQQHSSSDLSFYTSTPGGHGKIAKPLSATDNLLYANSNDKLKEDQNRELHEKTVLLEKLQKQFDAYQTEMMQTNKLLNEEADTYRSSNSELNMKLALSDSRLESTVEKCKSLNTAIEKLRKELETQKERNSKLNELIIKHEQSLSITSQESNRAQERVCELETKLHNMTFERDMLKSNHDRIVKERDMLVQENNSRSSILTNLEMIKNSCERNERETKLIYTQKIEQLERECHIQRKQLEQDQEKHEVLVKSWKSQYEQLQIQDEKEKEEHERTRKAFAEQKQMFTQLKEKCDELEAKLHSNELIVQMTRNTKSSSAISRLTHLEEETKDLHMKLSLADKEIVSLKIQLEESRGHAKQYKTIAETMEKTVKEASETNEKTKLILEMNISDLESRLNQLNTDYQAICSEKTNLEFSLQNQKENAEQCIDLLEKEKKSLAYELDLLRKKLENLERIADEREKHRDEYVAKLNILEDQLASSEVKLNATEKECAERTAHINELEQFLKVSRNESELEKKSKLDLQQSHEATQRLMNESLEKTQKENESLTVQINLLQQELSRLGQDLIVLQKQDSFKSKNLQSLHTGMDTTSEDTSILNTQQISTGETTSDQSSNNLLEINRYLRVQKDQLEEKYENMKLTFEINQQRLKTLDTDLDFYRKQSQSYESELQHLKNLMENYKQTGITSGESKSSNENINMILDTNKRLKEECDSLNSENSKLKTDLFRIEDDISNVKANLSESELRNESLKGELTCMVTELKRWKDRCDALLQSSHHADEWARIKEEVQKAQEKAQDLTDMINELRKNLTDANLRSEQLNRELDAVKSLAATEKSKLQQDLDLLRSEKTKREEMFKTLVNELREVVIIVQKELELKNVDWSMKGQGADKLKSIKEEIQQLKMSIIEKLKAFKEEIKNKPKQLDDITNELSLIQKRLEETDNKLKEKDTKIGQMNNFITQMKTKLTTLQKAKDDAVKEAADLKTSSISHVQSAPELINTEPQVNKSENDVLKSRFLQSQFECERLKKELAATVSALNESKLNTQQVSSQQAPTTIILATSTTSPQPKLNPTTTQPAAGTSNLIESQQAPPPTAYIVPSRITKIQQQQQQQQQQAPQQQQSSNSNLRRTAAVQPTPHDSGNSVTPQRQQVNPIILTSTSESNQQPQQQPELVTTESSQQQQQQQNFMVSNQPAGTSGNTSTSSGNPTATTSSFLNKRTREEDQTEEASSAQMGNQSTNLATNQTNNKKQRSSETFPSIESIQQQQHSLAAIEQYPTSAVTSSSNPVSYSDQTDYIVINDEMQSGEIQEIQDSQEEIILDDDDEETNNENPTSESQENEYDVIITDVNSGQRRSETISSENQIREPSSNNNVQLEDYENVAEDEDGNNNELNDQDEIDQDEQDQDDVVEEDDESNQRTQDDDDADGEHELRLDENDQENTDSNLRANSDSNEDNQNENINKYVDDDNNGDSQNDVYEDNNQNNPGQSNSPDSLAQQVVQESSQQQQQQQQNIQTLVVSADSSNLNQSNSNIQLKPSTLNVTSTVLFGQQQQHSASLSQTKSVIMPSTSTFGSSASTLEQQRKEPPKPIVWDASTANPSQQLFQSSATSNAMTGNAAAGSSFRIRRNPVAQTSNPFQQATNLQLSQSNTGANVTYFQTDNTLQQQQQQQQFRIQNNPFQTQQTSFLSSSQLGGMSSAPSQMSLVNETGQRVTQQRAALIRTQRLQLQQHQQQLQQQQQQLQQQQPQASGRMMPRGGGMIGTQNRRGGGNGGPSGTTGLNPAQRGGRTNF